ncbi:hypothetical protein [Bifidobacterium tsurumiense]|uniref:hypothetical protein n=1 Tax=Bifidobacterium tsurumiense TaxID=356829 RepID=UPI0012B27E8B|nr:hypothetical protein [Bifidobacterium tsurumiense]MDY4678390.1 hypothetical protein [Bifidobacterium tsurumiense]MSS12613.1 hypothetical protein [Bifidobacterium tsurumiense]
MNDIVYVPYLIPGLGTLRNLLHIIEQHELRMMESELLNTRMIEFFDGIPQVEPTIQGVQAIRRQLFQDMYGWAGQLRTI